MSRPREHWGSRLGFVLAAAGSAIGLGNLWKFPYITWNNEGGAFVLVYLGCVIAIGLPIMIAELLIGRRSQRSVVGAIGESFGRRWSWVGGLGVLTGFVILGYYTVIAGWTLRYFWTCVRWSFTGFNGEAASGDAFGAFVGNGPLQIALAAAFMIATVAVVSLGVGKGIERTARYLMPSLFAILLVLFVTAVRMEGAGEALTFIFNPDFSRLPAAGALEAVGHAFFTLSLGMGAMITYGSYLSPRESLARSALTVVVLDTLIAMFATIIMFSVIFSKPGMSESIGKSTAGMLFITLPTLFYEVVPMGRLLAPLFYLLVAFAALTSTISLLEVVASYFIDQRGFSRPKAAVLCGTGILALSALCGLSFGSSAGLSSFNWVLGKHGLFEHLDYVASNWFLPVGGFFITLGAGWLMTREQTEGELVDATTPRWFHYGAWRLFIRFVAPAAVAAIIVAVILGKDFS